MTPGSGKPRILLTGALGCLGSAVRQVAGSDHELVCMDIGPSDDPSVRQGDFTDAARMRDLLAGCDAVIHTASLHGGHRLTHTPTQFAEANVGGLVTMLDLCRELGVRRFVFSSTIEILVGRDWTASGMAVLDEGAAPRPDWIYPLTKLLGEQVGLYYFSTLVVKSCSKW
ncbi:MAG: NAD(P)-dependent oxidoreductase [Planctomycetota bacterium]